MEFKPNQKVRIVRSATPPHIHPYVGREGVVASVEPGMRFPVSVNLSDTQVPCEPCELEPLTDPRCSEFLADMKRFALLADKRPLGEILKDKLRLA